MPLLPVKIPPGFFRNGTQYQAKNRWHKGNLVRFSEGRLRPIGGWARLAATQLLKTGGSLVDPVRGLHSWRISSGSRFLAVGTTQSLRVWDGEGAGLTNPPLYNITPTDTETGGTNIFENQTDFSISGLGYGSLDYDEDVYGTPRYPTQGDTFAPVWTMDSFGDDLLACHSNEGSIWQWATTSATFVNASQTATRPTKLSGAPVSCIGVLVTPERHILALAPGGDTRKIQWASQESLTAWAPTSTNTAGDLTLQTRGRVTGGFKTRYGTLVFTTSDVWRLNYVGPPYVYGAERLTEGAGPVGAKSVAGSADFVAWMSRGRFWSYTGGYIKELQCDVADYIFADINLDVEGLIAAGHNPDFGEIIWFYPKEGDSTPKHYVTYSYRENHWTTGELHRSAWESSDALGYPVAAGGDGYLYRHEQDADTEATPIPRSKAVTVPADIAALSTQDTRIVAKGVPIAEYPNVGAEAHLCYAESGAIELGSGDRMMSVTQIITDSDAGDNGLRIKVQVADTPDETGVTVGPYPLQTDGYTDTRFVGRQAFLTVESPYDQDWRVGELRLDARAEGRR